MPHIHTNITVTLFNRDGSTTTTAVSHRKLYEGRTEQEIADASRWSKQVCKNIYGEV
jgi:hypothetical protein